MELNRTPNCGISYLDGVQVSNPAATLYDLIRESVLNYGGDDEDDFTLRDEDDDERGNGGIILFTTAKQDQRGEHPAGKALRNLIEEENLGSVAMLTPTMNPNTGNYVTLYAWSVNGPGLEKWYRGEYAKRNPAPVIEVEESEPIEFSQEKKAPAPKRRRRAKR